MNDQQTIDPTHNNDDQNKHPKEELPDVTPKNTKAELFKAYKEMVKKYQENIKTKKVDQVKKTEQQQVVQKAEGYTVENIVSSLDSLKLNVNLTLNQLVQNLTGEANKMQEIRQAIKIEQEKLQELYDIKVAAESLEELIKTQEAQKEEFGLEYEKMNQEREREKEEYEYNLKQDRKREQMAWQEKQEEFKKREEELRARENELNELRQKVEGFPAKLEEEIKKTRESTAQKVKHQMQIEADLLAREIEGDKKVMETKLANYEQLTERQNQQIESLKQELDQANKQVRAIAEKALESSSGKQTLKAVSDFAMRQGQQSERGGD